MVRGSGVLEATGPIVWPSNSFTDSSNALKGTVPGLADERISNPGSVWFVSTSLAGSEFDHPKSTLETLYRPNTLASQG